MYFLHVWDHFGSFWKIFEFYVYKLVLDLEEIDIHDIFQSCGFSVRSIVLGISGFCSTWRGVFVERIKEKFRGLQARKQKGFSSFFFFFL